MIPMYEKDTIKPVHEDERRSLTAMFNGNFKAEQIKIIHVKKDSILGNHYHGYRECFYVLEGHAQYTLEDINTKERREVVLNKGNRMIISPLIAHKARIKAGTIMIEGTESEYISANHNDMPWEVN